MIRRLVFVDPRTAPETTIVLIDRATIFVRSGKGGDGCMSFRREKFVPKGGPDGGDGGDGGDVVLVADDGLTTLLPLTPRPHYRAAKGQQGMGKSMHGASGDDLVVKVPLGTVVYDANTGDELVDLDEPGARFVAAKGGRGGFGNEHFKSATNQAPRECTSGEPAVDRTLRLELKLIADVGLVGLPNAGKSTMLAAVSRTDPRIADYPFTTLSPHLGVASLDAERRLVVADLPGLIKGAADGAGLGHDFLRHIERTRVLVHVVDVRPVDGSDPLENVRTIQGELAAYSETLATKPVVYAFNKVDLVPEDERTEAIRALARALDLERDQYLITSGATGEGMKGMLEACWAVLGGEVREREGWKVRE